MKNGMKIIPVPNPEWSISVVRSTDEFFEGDGLEAIVPDDLGVFVTVIIIIIKDTGPTKVMPLLVESDKITQQLVQEKFLSHM